MKIFAKLLALLLALCLLLCSLPVRASATTTVAPTTAQASSQGNCINNDAGTSFSATIPFQDWQELMTYMEDELPNQFPLKSEKEILIFKFIHLLDDSFDDTEKRSVTFNVRSIATEEQDEILTSINRLVRFFNDTPSHPWFLEWDPVYSLHGHLIQVRVYISMDRCKYPVKETGMAKLLSDSVFYESSYGFGSGKQDTWNADHWAYNPDNLVVVIGVSHLRESGAPYASDFIRFDKPLGIQPALRFSTLAPGSQRFLLIGTVVDDQLVVLGFTCAGNVRAVNF